MIHSVWVKNRRCAPFRMTTIRGWYERRSRAILPHRGPAALCLALYIFSPPCSDRAQDQPVADRNCAAALRAGVGMVERCDPEFLCRIVISQLRDAGLRQPLSHVLFE